MSETPITQIVDVVERLRIHVDAIEDCTPVPYQKMAEVQALAADEIERLRRWKAEATEVIASWEDVWWALGRPGELGESKAVAALRFVLADSGSSTPEVAE